MPRRAREEDGVTAIRIKKRFGRANAESVHSVTDQPPTRLARMLALAYHVDRLVEAGALQSYADGARRIGVTRARMNQVLDLLLMPLDVQEDVLLGRDRRTERALRSSPVRSGTHR